MTLNCCTFEFLRNFASIRRQVLYYDSPGSAYRTLTFALARLSCWSRDRVTGTSRPASLGYQLYCCHLSVVELTSLYVTVEGTVTLMNADVTLLPVWT